MALEELLRGKQRLIYNLGTGHGYSVQEVIETARAVTQRDMRIILGPRRAGDPAVLVADASRAKQELNWQPRYSDLATIIQHAWQYFYQQEECTVD